MSRVQTEEEEKWVTACLNPPADSTAPSSAAAFQSELRGRGIFEPFPIQKHPSNISRGFKQKPAGIQSCLPAVRSPLMPWNMSEFMLHMSKLKLFIKLALVRFALSSTCSEETVSSGCFVTVWGSPCVFLPADTTKSDIMVSFVWGTPAARGHGWAQARPGVMKQLQVKFHHSGAEILLLLFQQFDPSRCFI